MRHAIRTALLWPHHPRGAVSMPLKVVQIDPHSVQLFANGETPGIDKVMSAKRFTKHRHTILPPLRAQVDAPPRTMRGASRGDTVNETFFTTLTDCLREAGPNAELVRGFKMFELKLSKPTWGSSWAWKAQFWAVVARPIGDPEDGNVKYTDPNSPEEAPFVFVPSSLIHSELATDDLLSGDFLLGTVVGGCRAFVVRVLIELSLKGRRLSVAAASASGCVAKKKVTVRPLPLFDKWYNSRNHTETMAALGELMGFPVAEPGQVIDDTDIDSLMRCISPESLLDSFETLELELSSRSELLSGKLSIADARSKLFAHFDHLWEMLLKARAKRRAHAYELMGIDKLPPADVR